LREDERGREKEREVERGREKKGKHTKGVCLYLGGGGGERGTNMVRESESERERVAEG